MFRMLWQMKTMKTAWRVWLLLGLACAPAPAAPAKAKPAPAAAVAAPPTR